MNAFFYALMSLALAATNVNAIGETLGCGNYTISPKGLSKFFLHLDIRLLFTKKLGSMLTTFLFMMTTPSL